MSSPAAKTIRSNRGNIHPGNHDQVVQPAPKNKHSAEAAKKSKKQTEDIQKSENKSLARPKQLWRQNEKSEPLNDRSKQSSSTTLSEPVKQDQFAENKNFKEAVKKSGNQKQARKTGGNQTQTVKKNGNQLPQASKQVSGVKGIIEPKKGSSKSSSNMSLSKQVEPAQPAKNKNSAEAVKQNGNQKSQQVLGVQEKADPSKDSSQSSSKKILSEQVNHGKLEQNKYSAEAFKKSVNQAQSVKKTGTQLPRASKQVAGIKDKTESSKGSSKSSSKMGLSERGYHLAENKISVEAVKTVGNQTQAVEKSVSQRKAVEKSVNQSLPVKKTGTQLPQAPKQFPGIKEETESSKGSSKSSSKMGSSERRYQGQVAQNKSCVEAVKTIGNQAQAVEKSVNQRQAVEKSVSQSQPVKKTGTQLPQAPKQVPGIKEKTESSKGSSSKSSSKMGLSERTYQGQVAQNKSSVEALKTIGNQTQPVEKSVSQRQAVRKNGSQTPRSPKQVSGIKKMAEPSKDSSRFSSRTSSSRQHRQQDTDNHHIEWDDADFVKSAEENCYLCEIDVACSPVPTEDEEFESYKLPDIAVLPCGHVFHVQCLQLLIPKEQSKDPSCFTCASLC